MIFGRSSLALITSSTEPTSTARWMLWTASNSDATWPSFSERTAERISAAAATSPARSAAAAWSASTSAARTRSSASVLASTSPANTTAAAGAPPMTDAYEPSTASTVIRGLSALENTTNAPP